MGTIVAGGYDVVVVGEIITKSHLIHFPAVEVRGGGSVPEIVDDYGRSSGHEEQEKRAPHDFSPLGIIAADSVMNQLETNTTWIILAAMFKGKSFSCKNHVRCSVQTDYMTALDLSGFWILTSIVLATYGNSALLYSELYMKRKEH
ncbi:hypothetical protein ZIOFF_058458 [Zingiber officinale]|uniref:Uncharacterized protein n=1 Tax=Zingiber officinale TaxID=94328 RepID=A0A8J5FB58_ZINOF|nr:hypothetical protein ZIOFF_058458 [Zingiber officinale]